MKQDRERERKLCCFMMKSNNNFFYHDATAPTGPRTFSLSRIHDHTQRRTTVGRTPMDEWSAGRRDLYLTTRNTYKRQASMPPVGFEPTIPGSERPQTHGLGRAATGIDLLITDPIVCCRWRKDKLINSWIISNGGMILLLLLLLALQPTLGVVFYSPVAGFSLLACEVSWSHTTTRHSW